MGSEMCIRDSKMTEELTQIVRECVRNEIALQRSGSNTSCCLLKTRRSSSSSSSFQSGQTRKKRPVAATPAFVPSRPVPSPTPSLFLNVVIVGLHP